MAILCELAWVLVLAITEVLIMYVPGEGVQWTVLLGAVVTCIIGEVFIRVSESG